MNRVIDVLMFAIGILFVAFMASNTVTQDVVVLKIVYAAIAIGTAYLLWRVFLAIRRTPRRR